VDPGPAADSLYFVSHKGRVLMNSDKNGKWRPVTAEPLRLFSADQKHFMGYLGDTGCYVIEVTDPGAFEFADLRSHLDEFESLMFNLAGRALQISDWFRTHQYCGNCGERTSLHEVDRAMVCDPCRLHFYPRLSPSIIVLVHRDDEVLLGRNHLFPPDLFSTLAGFVEPGESIEETVRREVHEEVGVRVGRISYRGSQPWPFPNSLMLGFHAGYDSGDIRLQEDEIAEARWFPLDQLPRIPGKFAISRWLIDDYLTHRGFDI
ncbi:uncharacterized protein METZ01_LOCUS288789, partial [marine metagenome]